MKPIAESELIVNQDGSVYHLHLHPNEIANTILTVGDPERVKSVSKYFDTIEVKKTNREFVTHTGLIGKKRVTVLSTGIGTDNIDIVLNELDALVNINLKTRTAKSKLTSLNVIRIGTSGGLQKELGVDSFVSSSMAIGTDNLMHFYKQKKSALVSALEKKFTKELHVQAYGAVGSAALNKHFDFTRHQGITVTCPGFYAPQGRVLRYGLAKPRWIDELTHFQFKKNKITNFEMETAGIYGMGNLLGHQCLSLSLIVANRITKQFSSNYPKMMDLLIRQTLEKVESI